MKCYRVSLSNVNKIRDWLKKGRFKDFSFKCWSAWNLNLVECLKRDDVYVFVLEDDKGDIKLLVYAEVRDAVKNKLDVDTATNAIFLMSNEATVEDYKTFHKWIFQYAYSIKCYRADFIALKVIGEWMKELCGDYCKIVDERQSPLGLVVRIIIDIKGLVEAWQFSQ
jgi:hypothetical protein